MSRSLVEFIYSITLPLLFFSIILCKTSNAAKDGLREDPSTIDITFNSDTNIFSERYHITIGTTKILVKNIPQDYGFFLIQVHSFAQKVTFTNDTNFNLHNSVHGTNIGLVKILLPTDATKTFPFYLQPEQNGMVLIAVSVHSSADPIPGGCSMTFNTDVAPYINLTYTNALIEVDYQEASMFQHFCEENIVRLEMYRIYVTPNDLSPDTYFKNIELMLTADNIRKNGENITAIGGQISNLRKYISGYMGLGQIIAIVAVAGDRSTAYVPAATYSCNVADTSESCYDYNFTWWSMLSTVTLIFGILMFCIEDWNGVITTFFLSLGTITYVIYNILIYTSVPDFAVAICLIGFMIAYVVIFGCVIWKLLVSYNFEFQSPKYPDFVVSLLCGTYIGALIVSGDVINLSDSSVYWCVFAVMSVIMIVFFFGLSFVNPFSYNLMAVILIISSVSYFAYGTIHHIVTDFVRYMTVKHYDIAVKVDMYNVVCILGAVFLALVRSFCTKAEGRPALRIRIIRVRIRDRYTRI